MNDVLQHLGGVYIIIRSIFASSPKLHKLVLLKLINTTQFHTNAKDTIYNTCLTRGSRVCRGVSGDEMY